MSDGEASHDRSVLLAFVERHWRELTLGEARSLCLDFVDVKPPAAAPVKPALTYR